MPPPWAGPSYPAAIRAWAAGSASAWTAFSPARTRSLSWSAQTGSRDDATLFRWWHQHPAAPVVLVTGRSFDVLDVPAYAAEEALRRIKLTGHRLGPIARDGDRRLLIWLAPSCVRCADLMDRRPWAHGSLDLHRRRAGEYVTAPPFHGAQWMDPAGPVHAPGAAALRRPARRRGRGLS